MKPAKPNALDFKRQAARRASALLIACSMLLQIPPSTVSTAPTSASYSSTRMSKSTKGAAPVVRSAGEHTVVPAPEGHGIELKQVSTPFVGNRAIDYHQPSRKLLASANYPSGQPNNLELIDAYGAHRPFSNLCGLSGDLKIVAAREDAQVTSAERFKPGELFIGTDAPGVIARLSADGASLQNPWVTLPDESGQLTGLYIDGTNIFGGDLIAITTEGCVWRINSYGVVSKVGCTGVRLEGVVTIPSDAARYGVWAGRILVGAKEQAAIYALDAQGRWDAYAIGISPSDIKLVAAHENFYGVDVAEGRLWGAPAEAFTGMIGDLLVVEESTGTLARLRWNGAEFELGQIAQAGHLKQLAFAPAGVQEIPAVRQVYDRVAVVRHAPSINSGRIEGALWQLAGENLLLDGNDAITSDLLVPGTPTVKAEGTRTTFGGVIEGTESAEPAGYSVTLKENASLRYLITRTDPIQLSTVPSPPAPAGTLDITISSAGETVPSFASLRHLSIKGKAGAVSVPPGTYGRFTAAGRTAFVLGAEGATLPAVYNLEELSLTGGSELRLVGPVALNVRGNVTLEGSALGAADNPQRVVLSIAGGALRIKGGGVLYGIVRAPLGAVTIEGGGRLRGTVSCDLLNISGNGLLQVTEKDIPPPPVNRPPTVEAGADQTITLPTDTVSLNGLVSDDGLPAASALTTLWTKMSGPGAVFFSNPRSVNTSATFTAAGTYVLKLRASDTLLTTSDQLTVTVIKRNQAPVVDAGEDQSVTLPGSLQLNGAVSDDALPSGSTVTVNWKKLEGPGTVTFDNPNAAQTTAAFGAPGTYRLELSASDTEFTATDEVTIKVYAAVNNQPPEVYAGADETLTLPANLLMLKGVVADDGLPTGAPLVAQWSVVGADPLPSPTLFADNFDENLYDLAKWESPANGTQGLYVRNQRLEFGGGGNSANGQFRSQGYRDLRGQSITFKYGGPATVSQLLRFTVRDDGAQTTSSVEITGGRLRFYADSALDAKQREDGAPGGFLYDGSTPIWIRWRQAGLSYIWETSADGVGWSVRAQVMHFRQPTATQYVRLDFYSDAGAQGFWIDDFYVTSTGWEASAGPGQVTFADAASQQTTATFSAAGIYRLRLAATDTEFTRTSDVTVTVNPGETANAAPAVEAGRDQLILLSQGAKLFGSVIDDGLPVGRATTASWSVLSGPGEVTFANQMWPITTANFSTPGYYVLRLTATDGSLVSHADLTVKVVDSFERLPGAIFVSGHDSDGHAGGEHDGQLSARASNIIRAAIGYVTYNRPGPKILLVTDLRDPGGDNGDPRRGLRVSGFTEFDVADYGSNQQGTLDLRAVNFKAYDVVFVASSYGGWLRQDELDILNARRADLIDFVNQGGGLVALAESAGRRSAGTNYPGTARDSFRFLPLYASPVQLQEDEHNSVVTPEGEAAGLAAADMVNSTENYFTTTGGMEVLDKSAAGNITSLGIRGRHISPEGLGNDAPIVYAGPDRVVTIPHAASLMGVATDDARPAEGALTLQWTKAYGPGSVTFENPYSAVTSASFDVPGTYQLRLTASDGELSSYAETRVVVNPSGQYVVVEAGQNQSVRLPVPVNLSASVTDGRQQATEQLATLWSKQSGPGQVEFTNAAAPSTAASFSEPGVYVLRFTARDSLHTGFDELTVTARPQPPEFGDDFNDNTLDPAKWSYGAGFTERSQQLQVEVPDAASLTEIASAMPLDMTGDRAFVSFEIPDYADPNYSGNRLIVWRMESSPGHGFLWGYRNGTIEFYRDNVFLYSYPFGLHPRFWRIIHYAENDRVNYDTSNDGVSWQTWYSLTAPYSFTLDRLTFRLFVGAQGTGAAGTVSLDNVNSNVRYVPTNSPPVPVPGGPYQAVAGVPLQLDGSLSHDTLDIITAYLWDFGDGSTGTGPKPLHTYTLAGTYTVRLTVTDPEGTTGSSLTFVNVTAAGLPNQSPVVEAGANQTITLPDSASLAGSVSDDQLPAGAQLSALWSKVSGPGLVTFADASNPVTTASFSAAGTYVLRLVASDTELSSGDEVTVEVFVPTLNQPPAVYAGEDQTVTPGLNMVRNPGCEKPLAGLEISDWTPVSGGDWAQGEDAGPFPLAFEGESYFVPSADAATVELRQDVDVSAYAASIGAGAQQFEFKAAVRSAFKAEPDACRVVFEFLDQTKENVLGTIDSGEVANTEAWQEIAGTYAAPDGTAWIRVRLIAVRHGNATTDAYFDAVSVRAGGAAAKLYGSVTDDGLPAGAALYNAWSVLSGPGLVTFADSHAASTSAGFKEPGVYLLRLTSSDGEQSARDEVTVTVTEANQPPVVEAGANQTITLTASASLAATVTDDGLPLGTGLSTRWKKVSGPGAVAFVDSGAQSTGASFSEAGTYVLRLTATDSDLSAYDDVVIRVESERVNRPPVVEAGASRTITLPAEATLTGSVSDDGLPEGTTLSYSWTVLSGPGEVSFSSANSLSTTAAFGAEGVYVLRFTASDGELAASDETTVTVNAANQAPSVSAGADQEVMLPDAAAALNATVSDDGKPAGNGLSLTWSLLSGPGQALFADQHAAQTIVTFNAPGAYTLRLTATDSELTSSDDVTINVRAPQPGPTVELTSPMDGAEITSPVDITGTVSEGAWRVEYSLSTDDGSNDQTWTTVAEGSGPVTNARLCALDSTLLLNGTYSLRLSATDQYGQTSSDTISVVVDRNLKVGNFTISFNDLSVPVAGLPLQITRSYDSRDKRAGDFGVGWTMGITSIRLEKTGVIGRSWEETSSGGIFPNYCLQPTRPHYVSITFPDGKLYKFRASTAIECQRLAPITSTSITFKAMQGTNAKLEAAVPTEVQVSGSVPGAVDLVSLSNPDIYNASLFRLTTEDGTVFLIDQKNGVQSVTDTNNNHLTITRDGVTHSSGKSVTFVRDGQGRIKEIKDPAGHSLLYTYDANGDLKTYRDAENNTTLFAYQGGHYLTGLEIKSGDGAYTFNPIKNFYEEGRLVRQLDASGKEVLFNHDLAHGRETIKDRLGNETLYEYDDAGNVVYQRDAEGNETRRTYDAYGNVRTETTAKGTTAYDYYDNDLVKRVTDYLGNTTEYTYDRFGQVLTAKDARGNTTSNTYSPATGSILSSEDAEGNRTEYEYYLTTGLRSAMKRIDRDDPAHQLVTLYTYYDNGNLKTETDPAGNLTVYTYDSNNNRTAQKATRTRSDGTREDLLTVFEYDHANRLVKTIYPDLSATEISYNALGKQAWTKDQLGRKTEYRYDEQGRLKQTVYADKDAAGASFYEESKYDEEGRRIESRDRAGRITTYVYDKVGRLVETRYPDGAKTTTKYDSTGEIRESTQWVSHDEGALVAQTTSYAYSTFVENGVAYRKVVVTNAQGFETVQLFDRNGNLWKVRDALGRVTEYVYDRTNRRVKVIHPDATYDETVYDGLGRTSFKRDQSGHVTSFRYDALGRLVKVIQTVEGRQLETAYAYDELGNRVAQTDANNHTTRFEYDSMGRRVKRTLPEGMSESYSYDAAGNLKTRTDFNGKTTTYTYDELNRLLTKQPDASLNQRAVTFSYTATGRRRQMTDATGVTTYDYDLRDRLKSKATPEGALSYTYDEAGNLRTIRSSNQNGLSVDYSFDELNRLRTVKDNHQPQDLNTTAYAYDEAGNLRSCELGNGVVTTYGYNSLNRLTTMTVNRAAYALASYDYELGETGIRRSVTELGGRKVTYVYDELYRLKGETVENDPQGFNGSVGYSYDDAGNRTGRTSSLANLSSQSFTYDRNDRLTSDAYDDNGNTLVSQGRSYTFDWENHLSGINQGEVIYAYDGDGNRVAKTAGGVTTRYLVDTNSPTGYAQVVEELQGGVVTRQYTYGHDLISQRQIIDDQWQTSFYQYDGQGSVRLLTDPSGNVTDAYTYDAFGNLISQTGTTPNEYLYTGERFDPNAGFYYLRARYMNPSSGRFLSMDSYEGSGFDPISLHKYTYADSDPINRIDPSGHFSLINSVINSAIIGALSGLAIGFITGGVRGAINGAVQGAVLGALVPLTGAGIGAALLGSAARGVFITGIGVGIGSVGVNSYSLATAESDDEKFNSGVNLAASLAFIYFGPKILQRVNTRIITAEQANAQFLTERGGKGELPWEPGLYVTETTIFAPAKYVRVYTTGETKPAGAWIMAASEIEGLTPAQIQQKFALPFTPTHVNTADVPPGTTFRIGTAGGNAFGTGGGIQIQLQPSSPLTDFHSPIGFN